MFINILGRIWFVLLSYKESFPIAEREANRGGSSY